MKPALLLVSSALFSSPFITVPPGPMRRPVQEARTSAPARPVTTPRIEATDLARLIWLAKADAAESMRHTKFSFTDKGTEVQVLADPALLRSGLAGLISASSRSMNERDSRMGLRLSESAGKVTLELSDAGPGLSVQALAAMYGAGSSGLSEARRRIERAGGVINVSSELGAGTVYLIDLPIAVRAGRETAGS